LATLQLQQQKGTDKNFLFVLIVQGNDDLIDGVAFKENFSFLRLPQTAG
jgi:hypothetical protein